MPDIFISYKHNENLDSRFADALRAHLLGQGHTAWMDVYDIPDGAYWPDAIQAGLDSAHTVIGVMSPLAVQSRNVKNEWDWAIVNGRRLLLIMLETCAVPMNYISIQYIDATADHAAAFERVCTALTTPTAPPAAPDDPHLPYLRALYDRINRVLAAAIIKLDDRRQPRPIDLVSERTRGAVDELFEQRDVLDPLLMVRGLADQQPTWETGDFRAAFDHFGGRVLLLGEPGAGKTITLLHFGRDAVVQRIQDHTAPLPILALIPTWDARKSTQLIEWIAGSYGAPPDARQVIEGGRALLLLDGLDELGSEREDPNTKERYDPRERFINALPALNPLPASPMHGGGAKGSGCGIIVTCRVADYKAVGAKIALNGAVTLQALSDAQMRDYLSEVPDLWAALEADDGLRDIARTPLLLSFFAFAYRDMTDEDAAQLRNLTESPGDLRDAIFARYVRERYAHEARRLQQRGEAMPFTLDEIYAVLGDVAMRNVALPWEFGENVLPRKEFAKALRTYHPGRAASFIALAKHLRSLISAGATRRSRVAGFISLALYLNLIAADEDGTWRFVHLLLRDYLAFNRALLQLSNDDPDVRRIAAFGLGQIGDTRAVVPLITALHDEDDYVRGNAVGALGRLGDARAVVPLSNALHDEDVFVRRKAVGALGRLGDARAVEPLITALHDDSPSVCSSAARALAAIGAPAVEPLLTALRDDDDYVRNRAAKALGQLGDARAVDPLITALHDKDAFVRGRAARALGQLGDARAVESLIVTLHDDIEYVCNSAAFALKKIGTPKALAALENPPAPDQTG